MNRNTLLMLGIVALGAFFIMRRVRDQAVTAAVVPSGGFTRVPGFVLGPEHAGEDIRRATGSVLPTGAARELIR